MSAHLSNEIVEQFHGQSLSGGDRVVIYHHILGCDACRRRVVTSQTEAAALEALSNHLLPQEGEEPYHLDPATVESFVDDKLDAVDRSIAKLHLEDCAECSAEVTDFLESLATMRAASRKHDEDGQRQEISSRRLVAVSVPLRIAAMVALIAFAAVVLVFISRWRSTGPRPTTGNGRDITAGSQPSPIASPQVPNFAPSPSTGENPPKLAEKPPVKASGDQQVLGALKDGASEIAIDRGGNLVGLPSLPTEARQAVKKALTGEPLNRPDVLNEIASANISTRASSSNEEQIRITYPVHAVIQNNQPTIRWMAPKTAEAYRVEIADETFHQVARSEDLPATIQSWTPTSPLKRGAVYTWTIRAVNKGGEPSSVTSQAKFKVLSEDKVRELNQLKSGSRSHLALGLFYAGEGMIAEAKREFGILAESNPRSLLIKKLLNEISSWQRK
jgi:hypothetical protein